MDFPQKWTARSASVKSGFFNIPKLNYTVFFAIAHKSFRHAKMCALRRRCACLCSPLQAHIPILQIIASAPFKTSAYNKKICDDEMQRCVKQTRTSRFVQRNGVQCVAVECGSIAHIKPARPACKRFHPHLPGPRPATRNMCDVDKNKFRFFTLFFSI